MKYKTFKDIDDITEGDKVALYCNHKNCKRYLVLIALHVSGGQFHHKTKGRFDARNQMWLCHQHEK